MHSQPRLALYPGTFDPKTNGHLDIVRRCADIFGKIVVAVAANPEKQPLLSVEERMHIITEAAAGIENVEVRQFGGLTVDYAAEIGARYLLRGLRAVSDFEYELHLAMMNRSLNPQIETFFVAPDARYSFLRSSLVKQIIKMGGDVGEFVPAAAIPILKQRLKGS